MEFPVFHKSSSKAKKLIFAPNHRRAEDPYKP